MDRRVLATLALVVLVTLAGCPRVPVSVSPEVDHVESDGDGYHVQVTVNPGLDDDDGEIPEVSVSGYSLGGERVCSVRFGAVADRETRTLECETLPSLLVADTPERGWLHEASERYVETAATTYRG